MKLYFISVYDLCKASRDRGCAHCYAMNPFGCLFNDRCSLFDSKSVLLIYDRKRQVFVHNIFSYARVSSDNQLCRAVSNKLQDSVPFFFLQRTIQIDGIDTIRCQRCRNRVIMLFRKHLCWSHNDRLIPTVYKSSCHDYSNLSFSCSGIALNKRLYSSSGLSIPQHFLNCFILIFRQCKRQRFYNLIYHSPGLYVILTTGRDLCTV